MKKFVLLILAFFCFFCFESAFSTETKNSSRAQAIRLYTKVTGARPSVDSQDFLKLEEALKNNDLVLASEILTNTPDFYDVKIRNMTSPLLTSSQTNRTAMNDFEATLIGFIYKERDARELLSTNNIYIYGPEKGRYTISEGCYNTQSFIYERDSKGNPLSGGLSGGSVNRVRNIVQNLTPIDLLQKTFKSSNKETGIDDPAGLLTTIAWGLENYVNGTHRRGVTKIFDSFLCSPTSEWMDSTLSDHWVGADIDRMPGGKPDNYQTNCASCHSAMDSMRGAFTKITSTADIFRPMIYNMLKSNEERDQRNVGSCFAVTRADYNFKFNRNSDIFPGGYVPPIEDTSWEILLTSSDMQKRFGWRIPENSEIAYTDTIRGYGLGNFGKMITHSEAFSRCMAKRAFHAIHNQNLTFDEQEKYRLEFEKDYNLKKLFQIVIQKTSTQSSSQNIKILDYRGYYSSILNVLQLNPFKTDEQLIRSTLPETSNFTSINSTSLGAYQKLASEACAICIRENQCKNLHVQDLKCEEGKVSEIKAIQKIAEKILGRNLTDQQASLFKKSSAEFVNADMTSFEDKNGEIIYRCSNRAVFKRTCTDLLSSLEFIISN